jgi:hypothetical protein
MRSCVRFHVRVRVAERDGAFASLIKPAVIAGEQLRQLARCYGIDLA